MRSSDKNKMVMSLTDAQFPAKELPPSFYYLCMVRAPRKLSETSVTGGFQHEQHFCRLPSSGSILWHTLHARHQVCQLKKKTKNHSDAPL